MNITDRARRDTKNFSSNKTTGPGVDLFFTAPNGQKAECAGMHTKHTLGVDQDGGIVNTRTVWVSFSEDLIKENNANYPMRNTDGEVDLMKHRVDVADSTGTKKNYRVQGCFPDEKLGYILLSLEFFKV